MTLNTLIDSMAQKIALNGMRVDFVRGALTALAELAHAEGRLQGVREMTATVDAHRAIEKAKVT